MRQHGSLEAKIDVNSQLATAVTTATPSARWASLDNRGHGAAGSGA